MTTRPQPVLLQNMPRDVAEELDRRYGLVLQEGGTGHVSAHLNDAECVKYDHRAVSSRRTQKERRRR